MDRLCDDLKLLVTDNVSLPSDLCALCLTSRSWRNAAMRRLYSHVTLDVHRREPVQKFIRSLATGASLSHTTSITLFYDPLRAAHDHVGPGFFEEHFTVVERDHVMDLILNILPRDTLHTFRFISVDGLHPLTYRTTAILFHTQKRLKHLFVDIGCPDTLSQPEVMRGLTALDLRTLHMTLLGPPSNEVLNFCAFKGNPCLERLCVAGSTGTLSHVFGNLDEHAELLLVPKPKLQELVYYNCLPDPMALSLLSKTINFASLNRLALWHSHAPPEQFLAALLAAINDQNVQLEHLALDSDRCPEWTLFTMTTSQLLDRCVALRSLHLGCVNEEPMLTCSHITFIPAALEKSIELLSLHNYSSTSAFLNMYHHSLLYQRLPNIRQLGLQIDKRWTEKRHRDRLNLFLHELGHLRRLRTLHLRQHVFVQKHFNPQELANYIVQYMHDHSICPDLRVLAIGMNTSDVSTIAEDDSDEEDYTRPLDKRLERHLYIKGYQTNVYDGKLQVVALPVRLDWLRDRDSELEVFLDYDPMAKWYGGFPGWSREIEKN